jgi:peptide/nickel transport system permease protein
MSRAFRRNRLALLGAILTAGWLLIAAFAPWIAPRAPDDQNLELRLTPPSAQHWLGTDDVGRDMLSRIIHGSRISLLIAVGSVSVGLTGGVTLGALAGFYGGKVDLLLSRIVDLMLTVPTIVLAIAIVSVLKTGIPSVILAVGITSVPVYARLVRSIILTLRELDYVQAARAVGGTDLRIVMRHLLPNALAPLVVQVTLGAGTAILVAASLSFLGLGVQPPAPEWGAMLSRARNYINSAPHAIAFPGLAIALMVLAFNLLGDGLRDSLDPRLRRLM